MFTGLTEDVGIVESVHSTTDGARLRIATSLAGQIEPGDSVSVDGVCLTATSIDDTGFSVDVMNQTLEITASVLLVVGDRVNLELAMRPTDRLGGHIVQGHVDGIGEVTSVEEDGFARRLRLALDARLLRHVVEKGSIALDGVSLTVATLGDEWIEVSLIPETLERTNLGGLEPGRKINVECDLIAKHVERLMAPFGGKEQT